MQMAPRWLALSLVAGFWGAGQTGAPGPFLAQIPASDSCRNGIPRLSRNLHPMVL
jgi:hypothetical protein